MEMGKRSLNRWNANEQPIQLAFQLDRGSDSWNCQRSFVAFWINR